MIASPARQLGGCVVCARSVWIEDLFELSLFTAPRDSNSAQQESKEPEEELVRVPSRRREEEESEHHGTREASREGDVEKNE